MAKIDNIVLVHGAFADGSGWRGVYDLLKADGFHVDVVQNPTVSLAGDVAATKLVLDVQPGPAILVGHSYGGVVITEAGTHPKVAGLVYVTAFAPDKGETVMSLLASAPPGGPQPPFLPPRNGFVLLDRAKFPAAFAGDVDRPTAEFMAAAQVPWGVEAGAGAISDPAWKTKPSWYLQVRDDQIIPYAAQQMMAKRTGAAVEEVPGNHAIYVSNPKAVAALIKRAAKETAEERTRPVAGAKAEQRPTAF
jgi:pimeloyl-ACP methyl ester carboxylesterase